MNRAEAALLAAVLTLLLWRIARDAATRRGLFPGTLPRASLAAAVAVAAARPETPSIAVAAAATAAAVVDARTGIIPDPLTAAAAVAAAIGIVASAHRETAPIGALCGAALPAFLYLLTRGRGIGLGDVKLSAALGIGLGPRGAAFAIAGAFACGALYGSWLLATRRARRGDALGFAPFLALGSYGALVLGAAG